MAGSATTSVRSLAALRPLSHATAAPRCVQSVPAGLLDSASTVGPDSALLKDAAAPPGLSSAECLAALEEEVPFQRMMHATGPVPRGVCAMGDVAAVPPRAQTVEELRSASCAGSAAQDSERVQFPLYRHPADVLPVPIGWTPAADKIRQHVSTLLGVHFNHCLVQRYTGQDLITEHSDKSLDIMRGTPIVNVSFGATRGMKLRIKRGVDRAASQSVQRPRETVPLEDNSIFILGWETNRAGTHEVRGLPKHVEDQLVASAAGAGLDATLRISLTLRCIATFAEASVKVVDGVRVAAGVEIWGQGAGPRTGILTAFGRENDDPAFDWDEHYGGGYAWTGEGSPSQEG